MHILHLTISCFVLNKKQDDPINVLHLYTHLIWKVHFFRILIHYYRYRQCKQRESKSCLQNNNKQELWLSLEFLCTWCRNTYVKTCITSSPGSKVRSIMNRLLFIFRIISKCYRVCTSIFFLFSDLYSVFFYNSVY